MYINKCCEELDFLIVYVIEFLLLFDLFLNFFGGFLIFFLELELVCLVKGFLLFDDIKV